MFSKINFDVFFQKFSIPLFLPHPPVLGKIGDCEWCGPKLVLGK